MCATWENGLVNSVCRPLKLLSFQENISVSFQSKIFEMSLLVASSYVDTDDASTSFQREDIPDEGLARSVKLDHAGYLDDRVGFRFRENAFSAGTLDVKAQDAQRRHLAPFAFWFVGNHILPVDVHFQLTARNRSWRPCSSIFISEKILACRKLDPVASINLCQANNDRQNRNPENKLDQIVFPSAARSHCC